MPTLNRREVGKLLEQEQLISGLGVILILACGVLELNNLTNALLARSTGWTLLCSERVNLQLLEHNGLFIFSFIILSIVRMLIRK
jgi:hypothetical protein